ncbi:hypothetical protein RUND412_007757 [Rhizina undulata]
MKDQPNGFYDSVDRVYGTVPLQNGVQREMVGMLVKSQNAFRKQSHKLQCFEGARGLGSKEASDLMDEELDWIDDDNAVAGEDRVKRGIDDKLLLGRLSRRKWDERDSSDRAEICPSRGVF